jgi:hypothetical protein
MDLGTFLLFAALFFSVVSISAVFFWGRKIQSISYKILNKLPDNTISSQLITQLRLNAEPLTIPADGTSKSTLSLQLLDKNDNPAVAEADFIVQFQRECLWQKLS